MNAREAFEKLYAGDYQTEEGAGELARIVSEALRDAESTESLYLSTLAELSAIKKRAEEKRAEIVNNLKELDDPCVSSETQRFYRPIDLARKGLIDFIIKGEGK